MNPYAQIKLEDQAAAAAQSDHRFPPAPSSDSGFTSSSDWSQHSSPAQPPTVLPLPHVRLARSVRGTERQRARDERDPVVSSPSSPFSSYYRPQIQPPTAPTLPPPSSSKSKSRRIPRPPNAFILYRSSLLNKGTIPQDVERRQQTLSRIAGQCWNLLAPEEKTHWQTLAKERAAQHLVNYPDYHFKPSPRGKGKAKLRSNEEKSDEAIRTLRETYVGIHGPSICASRQRKPKSPVEEGPLNGATPAASPPPPSSLSVSPSDMQDPGAYNWTAFSTSNSSSPSPFNSPSPSLTSPEPALNDPPLPPCFPQRTFPHFAAPRRPSTSLGFVRRPDEDASCFEPGYALERPASAASDTGLTTLVRDLNLTPTAANFGYISMPASPKFYGGPYSTADQTDAIRAPFPFAALNSQFASFPDPASAMDGAEQPSTNYQNTFSDAQLMMSLDDSYGFSNDPDVPFSFDSWSFDSMGQ
ncbi:hypothetical protein FB451DRAFT_19103 [Mycena latifolia]|nr:hypothetical protein FB451DRAFT_19103 [Mycena latifolia]